MENRELVARLRRAAAEYERVTRAHPGFERRILARIAVMPAAQSRAAAASRPAAVSRSVLSQVVGVAAFIALAIGIGFAVLYTRSSSPTASGPSWYAPGWSQLYFADVSTGWFVARTAAADGSIDHSILFATTDGGRHWNRLSSVKGNLGPLWVQRREILAMQTQSGTLGIVQNLLQSSDQGAHWSVRRFPAGVFFAQPFFLPGLRDGWLFDAESSALPSKGIAWRTSNGGESWIQVATLTTFGAAGTSGSAEKSTGGAAAWGASSAAILLRQPGSSYSEIFVTHDSGRQWQLARVPLAADGTRSQVAISVPIMLSDLRGLAMGTSAVLYDQSGLPQQGLPVRTYVLRTVDGGSDWSVPQVLRLPGGVTSADLRFLTDQRWIAIVNNLAPASHYQVPPAQASRLYITNDSGQGWREITPSASLPPGAGWDVYFGSPELGVASYVEGDHVYAVFKTTDGGAQWQRTELPTGHSP